MTTIPIRDVTNPQTVSAPHFDAPYRDFIFASLALGIGGGFLLSLLLPLARTLDWAWGATERWQVMVQLHGQLLLVGFAGLFVMGMGLRIAPRVSTRHLAFQRLIPALIPCIAGYLLLRSAAQPLDDSTLRNAGLALSAALLVAGSLAFGAVLWGTLLSRESKAEAVGWFFVLGAAGFVASSLINAIQNADMIRDGLATAPAARQTALTFAQQFGFVMMFIGGVGSRAIPGLTGQPRRQIVPRVAAIMLGTGVTAFVVAMMVAAEQRPGDLLVRAGNVGLLLTGVSLLMFVSFSGALLPAARAAAASKLQFWFVRCAFAWMAIAAALIIWYGVEALADATLPDQFALDAIRHAVTLGVITNIIIGMAMLIVPEFAGRRLQHPGERWLIIAILLGINIAAVLRVWPALEGIEWLEDTRFWPMAGASAFATASVLLFGGMFAQSWWEQRDPDWAQRTTLERTGHQS